MASGRGREPCEQESEKQNYSQQPFMAAVAGATNHQAWHSTFLNHFPHAAALQAGQNPLFELGEADEDTFNPSDSLDDTAEEVASSRDDLSNWDGSTRDEFDEIAIDPEVDEALNDALAHIRRKEAAIEAKARVIEQAKLEASLAAQAAAHALADAWSEAEALGVEDYLHNRSIDVDYDPGGEVYTSCMRGGEASLAVSSLLGDKENNQYEAEVVSKNNTAVAPTASLSASELVDGLDRVNSFLFHLFYRKKTLLSWKKSLARSSLKLPLGESRQAIGSRDVDKLDILINHLLDAFSYTDPMLSLGISDFSRLPTPDVMIVHQQQMHDLYRAMHAELKRWQEGIEALNSMKVVYNESITDDVLKAAEKAKADDCFLAFQEVCYKVHRDASALYDELLKVERMNQGCGDTYSLRVNYDYYLIVSEKHSRGALQNISDNIKELINRLNGYHFLPLNESDDEVDDSSSMDACYESPNFWSKRLSHTRILVNDIYKAQAISEILTRKGYYLRTFQLFVASCNDINNINYRERFLTILPKEPEICQKLSSLMPALDRFSVLFHEYRMNDKDAFDVEIDHEKNWQSYFRRMEQIRDAQVKQYKMKQAEQEVRLADQGMQLLRKIGLLRVTAEDLFARRRPYDALINLSEGLNELDKESYLLAARILLKAERCYADVRLAQLFLMIGYAQERYEDKRRKIYFDIERADIVARGLPIGHLKHPVEKLNELIQKLCVGEGLFMNPLMVKKMILRTREDVVERLFRLGDIHLKLVSRQVSSASIEQLIIDGLTFFEYAVKHAESECSRYTAISTLNVNFFNLPIDKNELVKRAENLLATVRVDVNNWLQTLRWDNHDAAIMLMIERFALAVNKKMPASAGISQVAHRWRGL